MPESLNEWMKIHCTFLKPLRKKYLRLLARQQIKTEQFTMMAAMTFKIGHSTFKTGKMLKSIAGAFLALVLVAPASYAQTPSPIGQFRDWAAYTYNATGGRVCYAITQPKESLPPGVNRGEIYYFVSQRPGEGVRNEISVITGYPYQEGSTTTIEIGTDKFNLFTQDDGAWIRDQSEQDRLVASMRRGSNMIIKGTSRRGTLTTDTYSLLGISAALNELDKICGK